MTGASSSRPVVFGPADDDAFVRPYLQTLLRRSHALNTAVHQDDEMFLNRKKMVGGDVPKALCSYFGLGKQVFDAAAQILLARFGSLEKVSSILDFACGYGRSTRFLIQEIPPERVWASDISVGAVRFQQEQFRVHGLASAVDPQDFNCDERFDCVFVSSLFTHLPERVFTLWLRKLWSLLKMPWGCLVFSVHGPAINPNVTMPASGFWFEERSEIETLSKKDYGSTLVTESFVRNAIQEATGGAGSYLNIERGLCRRQDLYVVTRGRFLTPTNFRFGLGPQGYLETCSRVTPQVFSVTGWAGDATPNTYIDEVQIRIDGRIVQKCMPFAERPDVAKHFNDLRFLNSGLACNCLGLEGTTGSSTLTLKAVSSNGQEFIFYHDTLAKAFSELVPH